MIRLRRSLTHHAVDRLRPSTMTQLPNLICERLASGDVSAAARVHVADRKASAHTHITTAMEMRVASRECTSDVEHGVSQYDACV
jgi:hypothetical protein